MDLGGRKSLDDDHGAAALGAEPKRTRFLGRGGFWFGLRWLDRAEKLKAKRQKSGTPPAGQETEVANADEAFGQQVQQEAAQGLIEG